MKNANKGSNLSHIKGCDKSGISMTKTIQDIQHNWITTRWFQKLEHVIYLRNVFIVATFDSLENLDVLRMIH